MAYSDWSATGGEKTQSSTAVTGTYSLSLTPYPDMSTGNYESKSFYTKTWTNNPRAIFMNSTGTKLYLLSTSTIYQFTMSTAYDITTASYDSVSFSVSGQDSAMEAMYFKSDGLKLYILGTGNDRVYQYSLSVAWDLSTASYDSSYISVQTQTVNPAGIYFKSDGTKMYISETSGSPNKVYQYTLGTPWSISTATYDTVSYSLAIGSNLRDISFSGNGKKMFVLSQSNKKVYQYSLGTAWDLSTASDDSIYLDTSQDNLPEGAYIPEGGNKAYMVGTSNDYIYQYSLYSYISTSQSFGDLSSYFDIINNIDNLNLRGSFNGSSQSSNMFVSSIGNNGTKLYMGSDSGGTTYQYTLSTAYDISTASYDGKSKSMSIISLIFKPDGTKMYVSSYYIYPFNTSNTITQYTLSTPWDISTASSSGTYSQSNIFHRRIFFKSDGTKMYSVTNQVSGASNLIRQYTLSTPWDITTASYDSKSFSVDSEGTCSGIVIISDGINIFTIDSTNNRLHKYTMGTPWDISTTSYTGLYKDISSEGTSPTSLSLSDNESHIYFVDHDLSKLFWYSQLGTIGLWVKNGLNTVASVKLKIGSDSSNYSYYTGSIYQNSLGFTWQNTDGFTYLVFNLANPTSTVGSPNFSACDYAIIEFYFTSISGEILVDYFTISRSAIIGNNGLGYRVMYKPTVTIV